MALIHERQPLSAEAVREITAKWWTLSGLELFYSSGFVPSSHISPLKNAGCNQHVFCHYRAISTKKTIPALL